MLVLSRDRLRQARKSKSRLAVFENVSSGASVPAARCVVRVVTTVLIGFLIRANCLGTVKLSTRNRSILSVIARRTLSNFFQNFSPSRKVTHSRRGR
jgi:hypothetical protein